MSDQDYAFGTGQEPDEEHRTEYRLTAKASARIRLASADPDTVASDEEFTCGIRDISAQGFRIMADTAVTPGSLHETVVTLDGLAQMQLIVEVIWCRPAEDGGYLMGVKVLESDDTDYLDWLEAVADALSAD
ncbi:PilZ domain-containing protein [Marinobacter oulmenensis]|uniref:PilZ domain-containing protein n=1 Tax=Marinobacter oulmenensis TaxID=643747 RepID=A0A840UIH2_9GAMM|nr:PilZ domain-containing protein [Marinobacter oulmenensis]MBB5320627.1 hypothetical protein [Marinobacter oulmenensis]